MPDIVVSAVSIMRKENSLEAQLVTSEGNYTHESKLKCFARRFYTRKEIVDFLMNVMDIGLSSLLEVRTVVCVHLKIISSIILSAPT